VIHRGGRAGVAMTAETLWRSPYQGNLLGATARVPVAPASTARTLITPDGGPPVVATLALSMM
jgi:hypothetical protein